MLSFFVLSNTQVNEGTSGCEVKEHIAEKRTSWEIQWLMILSLSLIPGTE